MKIPAPVERQLDRAVIAVLQGEDSEAIVLYLVEPAGPGGLDERGFARAEFAPGATEACRGRPLSRAYRPFIRPTLKVAFGSRVTGARRLRLVTAIAPGSLLYVRRGERRRKPS